MEARASQPVPPAVTEDVIDDDDASGEGGVFEDAALHPAAEKLLRDMFGKWTREEASRASARAEMLRAAIREDLKADLGAILREALQVQREQLDAKLSAYTRNQEFQELSDRVDALSERLRTMAPSPPPVLKQEASATPRAEAPRGASHAASMPATATPRSRHQPLAEPEDDDRASVHREEAYAAPMAKATTPRPSRDDHVTTSSVTAAPPSSSSWMGPYEEGLTELQPADGRFTRVMSYRRYRLLNRASQRGPDVSRNLGIWVRRLSHVMNRNKFDGSRPVAILNFLSAYKNALDAEYIPEVAGLLMMHNFLELDALTLFEVMMNDAGTDTAGFASWPHAVQFLLETYATDLHIERAIDELESIRLEPRDTILQFKNRLTKAARELAGAYPQDALMTRFIRNLPPHIKDIVRLELPKLKGPTALNRLAAHADAYNRAHRAIPASAKSAGHRAFSVEQRERPSFAARSRTDNLAPLQGHEPTSASPRLVAQVERAEQESTVPGISDYTPTVEFSARGPDDGAPPDPYHEDAFVVEGARARFPPRPAAPPAQRTRESQLIPLVCFICYLPGHRSTECRHRLRVANDADFQRWQLANFRKLQQWQQMWLESINRLPALYTRTAPAPTSMATSPRSPHPQDRPPVRFVAQRTEPLERQPMDQPSTPTSKN